MDRATNEPQEADHQSHDPLRSDKSPSESPPVNVPTSVLQEDTPTGIDTPADAPLTPSAPTLLLPPPEQNPIRRSSREHHKPTRFGDYVMNIETRHSHYVQTTGGR